MISKQKTDLLPVYAVIGDDKLKQKTVIKRLESKLKEYGDLSLNSSTFDSDNCLSEDIILACQQIPFASEKRLVLVKNCDSLKKTDIECILSYLDQPNKSTVLILIFKKLAKSSKLYKACEKISTTSIIDCTSPKKYLIYDSVIKIARSHAGGINKDAAQQLVELVGEDTVKIDAEIQKMLLSNKGQNITIDQVIREVNKSSVAKPWDFTNAFASRNVKKCLDIYRNMPNGSEYMLLPQSCKIIKELICVKDLGMGVSQATISQKLNYEPWRVKNHINWARKFTKTELVDILYKALICEKQIKSTSDSALYFEAFIIDSLSSN